MQHYSDEFKRSFIAKSLLPGSPSLSSLAIENGLKVTTVFGWKKKYANHSTMKNKKNWTPELKLKTIIEISSLSGNELGEYLRTNGLYLSEVEEWKKSIYSSLANPGRPKIDPELAQSRLNEKMLQKNLNRKDKALSEMSARVILLKKTQLLFGKTDEDE